MVVSRRAHTKHSELSIQVPIKHTPFMISGRFTKIPGLLGTRNMKRLGVTAWGPLAQPRTVVARHWLPTLLWFLVARSVMVVAVVICEEKMIVVRFVCKLLYRINKVQAISPETKQVSKVYTRIFEYTLDSCFLDNCLTAL